MKLRLLKAVLLSFVILILGIINLGAIDNLPQECYAYFKGVVTDDQGQPLENAKVSIYNEKLGTYQSLTDKEGKYLLEVPSEWKAFPGTPYQILISKENYPALDDSQRFIQQKTYTKNYSLTSNTDYRFIKGKVYYKNTHLSLGQAKLTLKAKGSNKVISFTDSNSEGEFQLYLFDEKRGLFGSQKEYILSAEKEGYISFEKSISYEKDKIYNVYLEDITAPLEPKLRQTSFITNQSNYQLNGTKEEQTCLYVDDVKKTEIDAKTTWDVWLALEPGENIFNLYLEDIAGNKGPHKKITITRDDQAPALLKITPANHSVLDATSVNISGVVNDDTAVKSLVINDKEIKVSGEGIFSIGAINLNTGKNIFTIIIKDTAGNISNYGYELFSQIHVEGENIEDRKVNQPQVPAGEINSSDANPFMSTSKDLTSSRAIIIEEEPERAEGESSQAGALENNTPFFSAKKSPESNITYSSESNESKKDLVVFTSPYHNQIFSDDRLVIAGKYASEDVEEILVNGQTCVLDKENMTFIGPMLISPQEAKELGVAKNSKDYILVKVDQATHSGKNTLRCEVKLNGKKEEKEITYYYYQLFVKRDAYQHDTAIHKFEKDENEEQCFNFNLFNNPPYSLWEELEKNSRGRHPCSIRNNNWYYSLQETSPWFSLSDISYLNWYNGNNCENAKYKGETNYTIHTLPKIDNKLTPMVLILSDCRFVEMYIEQTFDIGEYKINNQELRSANNSINDSTFFVIIDKYSPDSDMLLNVKASSYDSGSNNEMHSWFSFNSVELLQGDIVVDSNNDGVLGGEDNQVEMQSPGHVFWVNNDDDYDESDVHPDDEDAKNSKGNDSGDDYINGIRDLEDFTLVNIKIPHMKDLKKCSGLKFYLRSEGKGKINVFKRLGSDPRNPKLYLNDLSQSIEQYKQKKLFDISAGKDAELNIEDFDMNGVFHGIFEGVKEGDITLKLIVEFGDSGKEKNSIVLDEAIVVIRDIRQFYKCYNLRNGVSINARNVNVYNWKEDKSHQMFFDNPDEIIIFAHGANNSADDAICFFNTFYKRLYHMGYRDGLACINWESDEGSILLPKTYFDGNWINSFQSAEALSEIIKKLHHEYPNAVINIGAHSLGNNLISYALRLLAVKNEIIINNVILMEAAIPGNAYSGTASSASFFNNMYGINTSNVTNCIYNTYSSTDEILPLFRIDLFIGLPTPLDEEYNLIDIHNSLFEYLLKCMMKPYQAWLWDVIVNNKYFHICWSGAMGDRVAHSRYDNFVNHDMHKSKKIDVAGRPYRIRKHCSMSEEYLYDVQEFYNYIIGNNVD